MAAKHPRDVTSDYIRPGMRDMICVVLLVFPILAAMDAGAVEGLKFLAVVSLFAVPASVVIGSVFVLLAYAIYALFRRYDLLSSTS